jgi:GxxExxY protein
MPQLNIPDSIDYPYSDEAYAIVGACMEVHNQLGRGFLEAVYKDALQHEFKLRGIEFEREKRFEINYKDTVLPH